MYKSTNKKRKRLNNMAIQKQPLHYLVVRKLKRLNETKTIELMAQEIGLGRNTLGDAKRTGNATPAVAKKITEYVNDKKLHNA